VNFGFFVIITSIFSLLLLISRSSLKDNPSGVFTRMVLIYVQRKKRGQINVGDT